MFLLSTARTARGPCNRPGPAQIPWLLRRSILSFSLLRRASGPGVLTVTLIIMEVDEQCGGFEVFTDQIVLVNRTVEEFALPVLCRFPEIHGRYFQQFRNRLGRAFQRGNARLKSRIRPLQLFRSLLRLRTVSKTRSDKRSSDVTDHQEVRGVITLIDQPCVFQSLSSSSKRVSEEASISSLRLISEKRHSEKDQ